MVYNSWNPKFLCANLVRIGSILIVLCLSTRFSEPVFAESTTDENESTLVEKSEGDVSGSSMVQLRGRNVADDWVELVQILQHAGHSLNYVDVPPSTGAGLCQTYTKQLRLPGCSASVLSLARKLNPHVGEILLANQKVKVPVLPLHKDFWTIVLDRGIPEDAEKLEDLEARWNSEIIKREESDTLVRLFLNAYNVFLPPDPQKEHEWLERLHEPDSIITDSETIVAPAFDTGVSGQKFPKRVIENVGKTIKKLFGAHPTDRLQECSTPNYSHSGPMPYSLLLSGTELPQCAKKCAGECPEINLFDTKVFLHPDIKDAVLSGGVQGEVRPRNLSLSCPLVDFDESEHHGTMLASLMVGQDNISSQFTGLAPRARLRAFDYVKLDRKQKRWARVLRERANDTWNTPQIFVFAGQFTYPKNLIENGSLKEEDTRLVSPDVVPTILDNKLIWITAAGHNDVEKGHQLTKSRPESPMNLGDQRNVIVVTSCEICSGKSARLWPNAYWANLDDGLVNLAAPGGVEARPIPGPATGFRYSKAWGTSQATAFVGGLAGAMLSCFPNKYKWDGRWLKMRLQITSDPMPQKRDAKVVTGGIVNVERALLDPDQNWLDIGNGVKSVKNLHWCKHEVKFEISEYDDEYVSIPMQDISSIIRFHENDEGEPQWQISTTDLSSAKVRWSGPGRWFDTEPILYAEIDSGASTKSFLVAGAEIFSFVPQALFDKIGVKTCSSLN